ncbi:MAG: hypothetical protein ACR2NU_13980, partial [Aeoliella sp.]
LTAIADANAVGRELWTEFIAVSGNGVSGAEFASLDEVSLTKAVASAPGPAILSIDGDYEQSASGSLLIDLMGSGGATGIDFDRLAIAGDATLAGVIKVTLAGGFLPTAGDSFPVLTAGQVDDTFDTEDLPDLAGGLVLEVDYSATKVEIAVGGVLGDYNHDNIVDAADYTVWRDSRGQTGAALAADGDRDGEVNEGDYSVWKTNFGAVAPSAASAKSANVPEPAAVYLVLLAGGGYLLVSRSTAP